LKISKLCDVAQLWRMTLGFENVDVAGNARRRNRSVLKPGMAG
jgi:hypothetical protein